MDILQNQQDLKPQTEAKEYQTLFWVPMLFQSATNATHLIDDMINLIDEFHSKQDDDEEVNRKNSFIRKDPQRRQQILGDMLDSEVVNTQLESKYKSEETKQFIMTVLKRHFLFSKLQDYELDELLDLMDERFASEGEVIIREGEQGDEFYILEEGKLEFLVQGNRVGTSDDIQFKGFFGDLALLSNSPRAATITALRDCNMWTLSRQFFRQAMVTSSSKQSNMLIEFLSKIKLFSGLDAQSMASLARSLVKQTYQDGELIIRQGDIGEHFYIVYEGSVLVTKTCDDGVELNQFELKKDSIFGERALIRKEPRARNIRAVGNVECLVLGSSEFSSMLGNVVEEMNSLNEFRILRELEVFKNVSDPKLKYLRKQFTVTTMVQGQKVLFDRNLLFIIFDGSMETSTGVIYTTGNLIGNLTEGSGSNGSMMGKSEETKLVTINRQNLIDGIANNEFIDEPEITETNLDSKTVAKEKAKADMRSSVFMRLQGLALSDLEIIKPLGKGTFGSVYIAKHIISGFLKGYVALKCLDKKALVENSQQAYIKREIAALHACHHPFIVEYFSTCWTPRKLFILMEHLNGGELWYYLYGQNNNNDDDDEKTPTPRYTKGPFGGVPLLTAALYSSNILLALEHIHSQGYVFRDLKPENLLISSNGYLKLIDFGFAKQVPSRNKLGEYQYRTFTLCGTPEYISPEIVMTLGHDKSTDFWSLGVLLYEMLVGNTPFEGRNQQRTFEKIVQSNKYLGFPRNFDAHAKSLIRRLLHPNASLRLGSLQNGFQDIKDHAFFAAMGISFQRILEMGEKMPYIPKTFDLNDIKSNSDIEDINLVAEASMFVENDYFDEFADISESVGLQALM